MDQLTRPGDTKSALSTRHGFAALAFVSFAFAFFGARLFATLNPTTIVEAGGIHFHHFWYGLIMVLVAGWLGISERPNVYRRVYAIVFGLGLGLIADEVGLLLTFGNYLSEPTYLVFVGGASVGIIGVLLLGFREQLRHDFIELEHHERLLYAGIVFIGIAIIPFAAGSLLIAGVFALGGIILIIASVVLLRRKHS